MMKYTAFEFTKKWEGCKLDAYMDSGRVPTIGVGHTKGVNMGDKITMKQAMDFLAEDIKEAEIAVNTLVTVPLTQNQFDALVDFTFNIGVYALTNSTLLKMLNQGDYLDAANQFRRWNKVGGIGVDGLTNRRNAERDLFMSHM